MPPCPSPLTHCAQVGGPTDHAQADLQMRAQRTREQIPHHMHPLRPLQSTDVPLHTGPMCGSSSPQTRPSEPALRPCDTIDATGTRRPLSRSASHEPIASHHTSAHSIRALVATKVYVSSSPARHRLPSSRAPSKTDAAADPARLALPPCWMRNSSCVGCPRVPPCCAVHSAGAGTGTGTGTGTSHLAPRDEALQNSR